MEYTKKEFLKNMSLFDIIFIVVSLLIPIISLSFSNTKDNFSVLVFISMQIIIGAIVISITINKISKNIWENRKDRLLENIIDVHQDYDDVNKKNFKEKLLENFEKDSDLELVINRED